MYFKHLKALVTVLFKSFSNMTPISIFIFQNGLMRVWSGWRNPLISEQWRLFKPAFGYRRHGKLATIASKDYWKYSRVSKSLILDYTWREKNSYNITFWKWSHRSKPGWLTSRSLINHLEHLLGTHRLWYTSDLGLITPLDGAMS